LLVANLWNFAIAKADLLPDHKAFLAFEVASLLLADPAAGARLVGLASRSGSDQFNLQLGKRRADNAKAELSTHIRVADALNPPGPPERLTTGSQGERFAERRGVRDGTEEARFRSVLVTVLRDRRRPCNVQLLPG
jgi:outer membrane protein OmpA-like peptidoglycan-associated protein